MITSDSVSILIPCFNAEKYIGQAIESALTQCGGNVEVVVVDDGSTDGSLEVIKQFGDRIRWESGPNRGGNVARNRLLSLSQGRWLQYLDADDYLLPAKVETQLDALNDTPTADVIFSPSLIESHSAEGLSQRELPIPLPHDPWILLARWYLPQTGACLWRKAALESVGGWKADQPCCQEHELYFRCLQAGKRFVYHPGALSVYRHWGYGTVSTRNQKLVREQRRLIIADMESFLASQHLLNHDRRWAVNMARFEMARSAWLEDADESCSILGDIHRSDPAFVPAGDAAPFRYRVIYRLLGFQWAERIAGLMRGSSR